MIYGAGQAAMAPTVMTKDRARLCLRFRARLHQLVENNIRGTVAMRQEPTG
jgi:hypothetical protein